MLEDLSQSFRRLFLIILLNLCNVRCLFPCNVTSGPLCNVRRSRQLTSCNSCTKLPCHRSIQAEREGFVCRNSLQNCFADQKKKLQSTQNCMHCASVGKKWHCQHIKLKHPASANRVTSHYSALATFGVSHRNGC